MKSVLIHFADRRVVLCNALKEEERSLIFTSKRSNNWTGDRGCQ